jgi:AmiR/NasT family two-component response regulator
LFPWPAPRAKIAILFGFESAEPTCASVPAHLLDTLNLASAAAWLFSELSHLHEELRRANHRFAGRKLVERAKGILQNERGMTEQEAYEYLRRMSRQRRITLSTLAENLLSASHWP